MKKLILIILLAVAACSGEDPAPKYTSLKGSWKFEATGISGSFVIGLSDAGQLVVKSGTFKTDGHAHSIDFEVGIGIDQAGPGTLSLTFIDYDGDNLSFTNSEYSEDFKTISSDGFFYLDGANYVEATEDVEITRK